MFLDRSSVSVAFYPQLRGNKYMTESQRPINELYFSPKAEERTEASGYIGGASSPSPRSLVVVLFSCFIFFFRQFLLIKKRDMEKLKGSGRAIKR